jgi:hypothetical protein
MNAHQIDRRVLLAHLHATEEKFPLRFVGLLPRGSAPHISGEDAVEFLAEKEEGLSLLGRPVGIILRSELHGNDEKRILAGLQPL